MFDTKPNTMLLSNCFSPRARKLGNNHHHRNTLDLEQDYYSAAIQSNFDFKPIQNSSDESEAVQSDSQRPLSPYEFENNESEEICTSVNASEIDFLIPNNREDLHDTNPTLSSILDDIQLNDPLFHLDSSITDLSNSIFSYDSFMLDECAPFPVENKSLHDDTNFNKMLASNEIMKPVTNGLHAANPNEWEVQILKDEIYSLKLQLKKYKENIEKMKEREETMKSRLSAQVSKQAEISSRFENINLGENRPSELIRRYGNLYHQNRLDAFDALDNLPEIADYDDLKGKLLFSVIVLAFRAAKHTLKHLKFKTKHLLCINEAKNNNQLEPVAKELEQLVALFLQKSINNFDLKTTVQEVADKVYATLYDYPSLQTCDALSSYIDDCVRLGWACMVQNPPIVLNFDIRPFHCDMHTRFHSSDPESNTVKTVLWPSLLEGENGPCLYKGVVVT